MRTACLLTAKPKSLPLDPDHLRLFGQKTIGDRGFECLVDRFLMRRMSDQNDRHRAARTNFGAGTVALHDAFERNPALGSFPPPEFDQIFNRQ